MDLGERREKIIELLQSNHYVTVEEFVKVLGVSAVTIRSDLSSLEKDGEVIRTHGGAMITEKKSKVRFISETMREYEEEKKSIAKKAASLISPSNIIIIDSGSTTTRIVEYIKEMKISVATNNVLVVDILKDYPQIDVLSLGGQLRRESMGTIGPIANNAIKAINADIYFMGGAAYSEEIITSSNLVESELKKSMIKAADKVVFLADSSKYGKKAFSTICSWKDVDTFITDKIDSSFREYLENQGVEVILSNE